MTETRLPNPRPFPWKCLCGKRAVELKTCDYTVRCLEDGEYYDVTVKDVQMPTCTECGQQIICDDVCEKVTERLKEMVKERQA